MNNEEKELLRKAPKSFLDKIKATDPKKKGRFAVILLFVGLMIFATITNIGLKTFNVKDWLINSFILLGIMVFGLFMGESMGVDAFREKSDGLFQRNLKIYKDKNIEVKSKFNFFSQWYSHVLPIEDREKKIDFLFKESIPLDVATIIVDYATENDLKSLCEEDSTRLINKKTGEEHFIEKIPEDKQLAVRFVLTGKIKCCPPECSYFLSAFTGADEGYTQLEKGTYYEKQKSSNKKINRTVKICVSLGVSLFWSCLTVYELMAGDDVQAWLTLCSRLTGFATSLLSGYLSGRVQVKIEASELENKTQILDRFNNDLLTKNFVPVNSEALAKQIWLDNEKKKEEAKKNVLDPTKKDSGVEIIPMRTPLSLDNKGVKNT